MRILEIETVGRGGLIHYAYNLSCALAARGHAVTLVTAAAYELGSNGLPSGVTLVPIVARLTHRIQKWLPSAVLPWIRKIEALADAWLVARAVRRLRPDVVHLHCTNQIALAYLMLLRQSRVPLAVTAHVVSAHERGRVEDAIRRRIHRFSPFIIAHSASDRRRLVEEFGVDDTRLVVIPHGDYGFLGRQADMVDRGGARRSLGLGSKDETALFFGYIREYKGLDVLLDAWPAVAAERPRARLLVAGDPVRLDPAAREALRVRAARLGAVLRFEYVPLAEVPRYFAAADLLVLPYRHVSQSGVLCVALALGVPVVATRVGALAEILRHGENAVLVAPESPGELADAVARVLGDPQLRQRLAAGGRRLAAEFSWPSIAEQTERHFARLARRA